LSLSRLDQAANFDAQTPTLTFTLFSYRLLSNQPQSYTQRALIAETPTKLAASNHNNRPATQY